MKKFMENLLIVFSIVVLIILTVGAILVFSPTSSNYCFGGLNSINCKK